MSLSGFVIRVTWIIFENAFNFLLSTDFQKQILGWVVDKKMQAFFFF